jgi:hypothetical protein
MTYVRTAPRFDTKCFISEMTVYFRSLTSKIQIHYIMEEYVPLITGFKF